MNGTSVETAARALADAMNGTGLAPAVHDDLVGDEVSAYRLQARALELSGLPIVGWKIGATNPKAQAMLATDRPFYGPIPARGLMASATSLQAVPGISGAEVEVAFILSEDLPRRESAYGEEEILRAIAAAHPVIEIIGLRQRVEGPASAWRVAADFGGNVALVHGPPIDGWRDLAATAIEARCLVDGELQGQGTGDMVLGGPLRSLAWLADNGPGLQAGQWVSTGTITGLAPVAADNHIVGDFGALGRVELRMT